MHNRTDIYFRLVSLQKSPGFFIDCGAADGEYLSNTLYLEKELGWTGLLVEAEPTFFNKLITKNRRAWLSPTCLSLEKYPVVVCQYLIFLKTFFGDESVKLS